MKILLLHWGSTGGGPEFSAKIAAGIKETSEVELLVSYCSHCDNASEWQDLEVPTLPIATYQSAWGLALGWHRWFMAALRLRRFIRENRVDVVYSPMLSIWQSLALPLTIPRGVMFVSSIHDAFEHPGEEHFLKALCRKIEIRRADLVVTYSDYVHELVVLQSGVGKAVTSIAHGAQAYMTSGRSLKTGSNPVIGFFGRLLAYKGLDLYVQSVLQLNRNGIAVRGVVYGDGEVDPFLITSSIGVIEWNIGWVDNNEISSIFERFDILALPYVEASQSGVLAQAIGRGVPVVATPVGGLSQQVTESGAGLMADDVSPTQFAAALAALVGDPALYESLSEAGIRAALGNLSWKTSAAALIKEILSNSGTPAFRRARFESSVQDDGPSDG